MVQKLQGGSLNLGLQAELLRLLQACPLRIDLVGGLRDAGIITFADDRDRVCPYVLRGFIGPFDGVVCPFFQFLTCNGHDRRLADLAVINKGRSGENDLGVRNADRRRAFFLLVVGGRSLFLRLDRECYRLILGG